MIYKDGFFEGADATPLYMRSWKGSRSAATVIIVHGVGEHSGRHEDTAVALVARGLDVCIYDHRGHGRSGGSRGHVRSFSEYRKDLGRFVELCADNDRKIFILGQSLGGLIALDYGLNERPRVKGIIACSPALELAFKVPWYQRLISCAASCVSPSFTFKDKSVSSRALSHDESEVLKYDHDPLVHRRRSARFFTEFMLAMRETMRHAGELNTPCLIVQGDADDIVSADAVVRFHEALRTSDKTLKMYKGGYHELLKDSNRDQVIEDITGWILERV